MNQAIEALTRANTAHFHALNALETAKADRDSLIKQVAADGGKPSDPRLAKATDAIAQASTAAELADASRLTAQRDYYVAQVADLARQRDVIIEKHKAAIDTAAGALQHVHDLVAQAQEGIKALHAAQSARNDVTTEGQNFDAGVERTAVENPIMAAMHRSDLPRAKLGMPLGYSQITVELMTGKPGLFGSRK